MANQIAGVKDKILTAALKEFLNHGYQNASLRRIADEAGTSTNSIYVRFKDKEGLFGEIVQPVADEFMQLYRSEMMTFEQNSPDVSFEEMQEYTNQSMKLLIGYVYDHFEAFRLLICCSGGTEYEDLTHKLAEMEAESTLHYIQATHSTSLSENRVSLPLLHMVSSAYLSGFFEIVKHKMKREEADAYVRQLQQFFQSGWKELI